MAPSGRLLAKLMVSDLYFGARVIELGSGAGTVTQAILDSGVREHDLCLIEQHDEFTRIVQHRFPGATMVKADALRQLGLRASRLGVVAVNFPPAFVYRIERAD